MRIALHHYRPLLTLAGCYLVVSFVLRLLLWWQIGHDAAVGVDALPRIVAVGAINDLIVASYLLLPYGLYLALLPRRWLRTWWQRLLLTAGSALTLFGMLYLAVAEYVFFAEFDSRFDLVAVDYLIYPHEVFINIWESYPIVPVVLGLGAATILLVHGLRNRLLPEPVPVAGWRQRLLLIGTHVSLALLVATGLSTYSLAGAANRIDRELTINGISSFFLALRTNELDYDRYYRSDDPDRMRALLIADLDRGGGRFTDPDRSLNRRFSASPEGLGRLNVVVIVEESFGARFSGTYGAVPGLTPEFDALARQGLLFSRAYATGTRTVRGLEAITTSLPPIPSEAVLKRPGSEHMANWGALMSALGYRSSFLYGGYGYFDNMNHFFSSNGFTVNDRGNIAAPRFSNIWGVSDQDLFDHALGHFDREASSGRPFFSLIMTTSNHRPYTFPDGIPGIPPENGGRSAGVRYADFALGEFFRRAREHAWYDDTLFLIVADHDARVYGSADIPVHSYRIPLLILAPGHLQAGRIDTPTSQIDIAPTVLGLLGLPYEAPFFGQNVLAWQEGELRALPIQHNHKAALYRGDELAVLGLQHSVASYRYDPATQQTLPVTPNDDLIDLATAYYQIAFELFRDHRYQ